MKLADKIALITGGGRGIGRSIAIAYAEEGARVFISARTAGEIERVAAEINEKHSGASAPLVCDVSNVESVSNLASEIAVRFGRGVDILVNNAGIAESAALVKTDNEMWQRHLAVNLTGTFHCMRAFLPSMIERGWGRIINIASIAGKTGAPYISAYSASKHGVLGLTRSAALEVAAKGVTVNAICPGYVETKMTEGAISNITMRTGKSASEARSILEDMNPQKRLVTPEEVASLALLLASDEGRGINGQAINLDGGGVFY